MIRNDAFTKSIDLSHDNLQSLIDEHSVFAVTDVDGIIIHANKKFVELSKYSKEELIGKDHNILRSDEHSNEFFSEMWNTLLSKQIWHGDIKNKAKDGSFYWLKTTITPLVDRSDKILGFAAIRTDITAQKAQQELLEEQDEISEIKNLKLEAELLKKQHQILRDERMSSIGQLAARIAHDIRNPLSIIQVSMENVKMLYGGNEIQVKQFDRIQRSINRITHQVQEVLDFVKGLDIEIKKVMMSTILIDSMESLHFPNNVKMILPKNDVELLCDKKQLSAVMNNLILNAIQAIPGQGRIEITIEKNNDKIIIKVMDSGTGIHEKDIDNIFEPLFTTKQQGTGLGLASVKSIIEAHSGNISVTTLPTVFTITLPRIYLEYIKKQKGDSGFNGFHPLNT